MPQRHRRARPLRRQVKRMRKRRVKRQQRALTLFRGPIPGRAQVKLDFVEITSLNVSIPYTSNYNYVLYRLNSAFDFNASLGTAALVGYNEWAAFYQNYRVHAVKTRVTFYNDSMGTNTNPEYAEPIIVGMFATANTTSQFTPGWTNFRTTEGNPWSSAKMIGTGYSGRPLVTFNKYYSNASIVGEKAVFRSDDGYQSATTTNPQYQVLLYCYALTASGNVPVTGGNLGVYFTMRSTLYIEFFNKKILSS